MSPTSAPPVSPVSLSEKTLPSSNRLTFTVAPSATIPLSDHLWRSKKEGADGRRCRIQSHAFICELVEIGDDCFISHGAMFINDLFDTGGPAGGDRNLWKETKIGNHVSIGTNATILPVTICDRVVVGAGAVVTKDITEPGIYVGNPRAFCVGCETRTETRDEDDGGDDRGG